MNSSLMISISYAFCLFVLILILVQERVSLKIRIFTVLASGIFYIFHFVSMQSILGWPASKAMPEHFQLLSWNIKEPNIAVNTKGEIFLWIKLSNRDKPRAYEIEYSRDLHSQLDKAKERIESGLKQIGRRGENGIIISNSPNYLPTKTKD